MIFYTSYSSGENEKQREPARCQVRSTVTRAEHRASGQEHRDINRVLFKAKTVALRNHNSSCPVLRVTETLFSRKQRE